MSRLIAWAAFLLGSIASVAANVAHARPDLGPRLTAAFAPLALVLAVELAVRVRWRRGFWWAVGRWGGTGLVAVVTAVVSYRHQADLLAGYGEDAVSAAILPLSVDGLMIVAAAALLALSDPKPVRAVEGASATTDGGTRSLPLDGPGEPGPDRLRTDAELIEQVRPVWSTFAPLTRYRIEQITGAGARQAQRILDALTSERTEDGQAGQVRSVNGSAPTQ